MALTENLAEPEKRLAPVIYKGLEWELRAYRNHGEAEKALFTYNEHESRLKRDGWDRAPTSAEFFGLVCDYLDGRLSDDVAVVAEDCLDDFDEYFCQASQQIGNEWTIFNYVTGLKFDKNKDRFFVPRGKWYKSKKTFDVKGLEGFCELKEVNRKNPKIVKYFYGRNFDGLPSKIREAGIAFPDSNLIWPVGRGDYFDGRFGVDCYDYVRASRGVLKINNKK